MHRRAASLLLAASTLLLSACDCREVAFSDRVVTLAAGAKFASVAPRCATCAETSVQVWWPKDRQGGATGDLRLEVRGRCTNTLLESEPIRLSVPVNLGTHDPIRINPAARCGEDGVVEWTTTVENGTQSTLTDLFVTTTCPSNEAIKP